MKCPECGMGGTGEYAHHVVDGVFQSIVYCWCGVVVGTHFKRGHEEKMIHD